jgi:hypothetical protein
MNPQELRKLAEEIGNAKVTLISRKKEKIFGGIAALSVVSCLASFADIELILTVTVCNYLIGGNVFRLLTRGKTGREFRPLIGAFAGVLTALGAHLTVPILWPALVFIGEEMTPTIEQYQTAVIDTLFLGVVVFPFSSLFGAAGGALTSLLLRYIFRARETPPPPPPLVKNEITTNKDKEES